MIERDDHDLTERFHALRREDAAAATPFRATLAAARARSAAAPRRRRFVVAAATALAAGLALVLLFTRHQRPGIASGNAMGLATVRWTAPTDFLLELPGERLLRSVPELGRTIIDTHRRTP